MSVDHLTDGDGVIRQSPVHAWFGLSYASFLILPRLMMQSMPLDWQERMVALLRELDETFDWPEDLGEMRVRVEDEDGEICHPPSWVCDYRRGSVEHLRRKPGGDS